MVVPGDDEETRRNKVLFTLSVIIVIPAALLWAGLCFAFREPVAALLPLSYSVLTLADIALVLRFGRFRLFQYIEQVLIFVLPVVLQLVLGGFVGSGAVIVWSFLAVLQAAMFGTAREARWWAGGFAAAVVLCAVVQPRLQVTNHLPTWLVTAFFALNIAGVSLVAFAVLGLFTRDRRRLRELEVSYLNQEVMLRQSEKLATLGTLAAGVAHELNNPAAAAARGAAQLRPLLEGMQRAYLEACSVSSPELAASIRHAGELIGRRAGQVVSLSPLQRSDRVEEMAGWLAGLAVERPADAARALVDLGYTRPQVEELTCAVPQADAPLFVSWLAQADQAQRLLAEVGEGAGRISQIVGAMRSYAYLDQAPVQQVDVTEGLESTLVLLGSKLKARRAHPPRLRRAPAPDPGARQRAEPGVDQHHPERGRRHGRAREHHLAHRGARRLRAGGDRRRRPGDAARGRGAGVRSVLYHQAARPGDRAWPEHQPQHRGPRAQRPHRGRLPARAHHVPGVPSGHGPA